MHRIPLDTAKHIVIIRRNGFGDLLCTMPLISYCRQAAPQAKITLVVENRNAPLAPFLRGFDDVAILPPGNKYWSAVVNGVRHWNSDVDIAISAKPTPMKLMNFSLWALKAKNRIAVVDKSWHSRLVNRPVDQAELPGGTMHQALAVLRLVAPNMTEIPVELYPQLILPKQGLLGEGEDERLPLLFVSVTSTKETNSLGVEGYSQVLNKLARERPFRVVISCERRDTEKGQALSAKLSMPRLVIPSRSIAELLSVIGASDLALVGDGGVMHMTAALNKPLVALFGRCTDKQWHPLSPKAVWHVDPEHVKNIPQDLILQSLHQQLDTLPSSAFATMR